MELKERIAHIVTGIGAGTSIVSGVTITEWGIISGILLGVAGFVAAQYWQYKNYRLNKRAVLERAKRGEQWNAEPPKD